MSFSNVLCQVTVTEIFAQFAERNRRMKNNTREDIVRLVREEDVEFIRLQFTDLLGSFKNIAMTASQLERILNHKCSFDTSPIESLVKEGDADLFLYPDYDTFEILSLIHISEPTRPEP